MKKQNEATNDNIIHPEDTCCHQKHSHEHEHEHGHSHKHNHNHEHGHSHDHDHGHDISGKKAAMIITRLIISSILLIVGFFTLKANHTVGVIILLTAFLIAGYNVLWEALENIFHAELMDENFLMSIASVGAFAIGEYFEAAAVMILFSLGEFLQGLAVRKSRKEITSLMKLKPDYVNIKSDGQIIRKSPETIHIEDIITVFPGEKIPLDGVITKGSSDINTSSLTGESMPREVSVGDNVLSGCINGRGELEVRVTASFENSTVSRILELVEEASERKSSSEDFITKFSKIYTPAVVILAILFVLVPMLLFRNPNVAFSEQLMFFLHKSLSFLTVSCPCALVISIPLTYFGGIGGASRLGILIKGSNYLEALSDINTVVWDKTGTLTNGSFRVVEVKSLNDSISSDEFLQIAAGAESHSSHPIARSICDACKDPVDDSLITDLNVIDGKGIECNYKNIFLQIGNAKMFENVQLPFSDESKTVCYICINNELSGYILLSDTIKETSKEALYTLKNMGIKENVMLTGDNENVANEVAKELNIDRYYSNLLPYDKVTILENIIKEKTDKGNVVFVGDGMNDAPVLCRADIGVAMGALGSDAAIEAADIVLMNDSADSLPKAVKIAKKTRKIAFENIIFALFAKVVVIILIMLNLSNMYMAVFADVGVCLIAILNSSRALKQ